MTFQAVARGHIHLVDGDQLWVARGHRLYTGKSIDSLELRACLPIGFLHRALSLTRLSRRALRLDIHHVVRLRDRLVVAGFGHLWCLDIASGKPVGKAQPIVGGRPLTLCVAHGHVYYGEYRDNSARTPIHILRTANGETWEVVRAIAGVRHIHGIYHDPYVDLLWMTTGDEGEECAIWRTTDAFATLERVHSGTQQVRTIPLLFTDEYVYYGTDTPLEANHLYRIDRRGGPPQRLHPVEGSVFHGAKVGNSLLFSTAVEPSEVNPSREAVIYGSRDGERWREVCRLPKDGFDMRYFQYGQLAFPAGDNRTGLVWFSSFALRPDFQVFSGELDDDR